MESRITGDGGGIPTARDPSSLLDGNGPELEVDGFEAPSRAVGRGPSHLLEHYSFVHKTFDILHLDMWHPWRLLGASGPVGYEAVLAGARARSSESTPWTAAVMKRRSRSKR